ncbi:MAG TPA: LysR family transcriptional regulator [Pseudonocardiaceae bacterium]|jgi:DNA-binding transcriptional LysR family regulator|nr:LysR family transcriptional regulator [Pseudonocardiaceae bacterium]
MKLRSLRYFVAIAHAHSMARAARLLRVSAQSLGADIKELEKELGFPLFDHTYDQLTMTDKGASFLPAVENLLAHADEVDVLATDLLHAETDEFDAGSSGLRTSAAEEGK